ncbi:hypothetical protein LLG95_02715 [bacterium]|nr:hypothetical protein [bacterium]
MCRPAFADRIYRNDGRIVEGVLEPGWEDASSNVRIRVGKATITVPRAQIRKILPGGQGDNQMIAAREAFGRRDLDQAILAMADGIKAGAAPESVATMLLVQADAIVKSVDQFKPEARTALSGILTKLDDVRIPRADELIAARVQLHAALGEFDKIDGLLEVLGPKYFEDHPDLAKQLAERLEAQVEQDVLTNDYKNGIDTLRRIERIDPKFASARKTQYVLEWGRRLRDAGKVTDALDLYIEQLVDDAPEIARDRIRVTLEEAEMTMRQRGQLAEAAELYEKYGLGQVPDFAKEHLVRLWRDQGARNVRAGKYDDAREDYRKAESIQAGGGATELLRVDYREKLAAIKDGDQVGHYELGVWCRKNGLSDEALRQFEKALDHPVVGPNAEAYIGRIKVDLADRELKRILGMYEKGQLVDALGAVQQFMIGNPGEGFLAQARELDRMIRDGLRLRQSDQNQQAVGLLEKAQRAYYSGDYDEANRLLQTIFKHYKGTVTYRQARSFYTMVRDRLTLAQLEQGKAPGATKFEDGLTTGGPATAREVDRMMRGLGAWQDADTTKAKDKSSK